MAGRRAAEMVTLLRGRYSAEAGNGPRFVCAPEVRNQASFGRSGLRSCDFMAMDTWASGPVRLIGHEVKVTRSDWLRELKDPSKAEAFIKVVAEWWLVVADPKIVRDGELPEGWGLLAPAGESLRAVVKAKRKPQSAVAPELLATLLRSVHSLGRADVQRAEYPKPYDTSRYPRSVIYDNVPYNHWREPKPPGCEIQPARHDLRRLAIGA